MKLYDCAVTPNPRRLNIFLAEKGIEVPKVQVDLLKGDNLKPEFLAINPRGILPTLELDDGTRFDEVMAICRYFEELYPWPALLGRDARERALVESVQRHAEFDGMIAGSEIFRNQHPDFSARSIPGGGTDSIPAIPALVARGRQTIQRFHAWLEEHLLRNPWLVGDAMTMADITAFCAVDFHRWIEIEVPAGHAATRRWFETMAARPSTQS